jgi:hypothetical protein
MNLRFTRLSLALLAAGFVLTSIVFVTIIVVGAVREKDSVGAKSVTIYDDTATPSPAPHIAPSPTSTIAQSTPTPTPQPTLPTFFPPKATATVELPLKLQYGSLTLQTLSYRISKALDAAGYERRSYFWLDKDHAPGFAIITHIEQIHADGTPVTTGRWSFDLPSYEHFSIASFLKTMIKADPGIYRMIALVVSEHPFEEKKEAITSDQVAMLNAGPKFLGITENSEVTVTSDYHCIAYVYEFERKTRNDDPVFKDASDVLASTHLKSTTLWEALTEPR